MADPTDVFDQWLKTWTLRPRFFPIPEGLAAPFKFVSHRTRTIIESFQSVFLPNRNIEIYADYIDDGEFNAAAGIHDNLGLIGLNTGAILRPIEVFYGMFSHPLALPNIGNNQAEKIGPQHSEGVPEDHVSLFKMRIEAGRSPWPTQPIDPIRLDTARLCIEMAWRFLIVHEITHILHGHVEYRKKVNPIPLILEVSQYGMSSLFSSKDLDSQTMELGADGAAVSTEFSGLLTKSRVWISSAQRLKTRCSCGVFLYTRFLGLWE